MLHKFFEPGDWFAPKKIGYGAGLPIAWQGWAVLAAYVAVMIGLGILLERGSTSSVIVGIVGMLLATATVTFVAKKRTRGGWKWRK